MTDAPRCGNCRWWEYVTDESHELGECRFPLPSALDNLMRSAMFEWQGATCPCHAPKEPDK